MSRALAAALLAALAACSRQEPPKGAALPGFALTSVLPSGTAPFGNRELAGRVWVVDFIFTSCGGMCPALTERMAALGRRLPPEVGLLSITVDPETDTPARLRAYMRECGADGKRWVFARGAVDETYQLLYAGFRLPVSTDPRQPAERRVEHSGRFVLVDKEGVVRGYYDGLVDADVAALERAARRILEVRS